MTLTKQHTNLFEKLHKLYVDSGDIEILQTKYNLNKEEAIESSNSAGALRFLNGFNSNFDCQSIGFNGKQEMRESFHQWLQTKNWKGTKNISNLNVLLRKFHAFINETDRVNQLNILVDKKKGNRNRLKFNCIHSDIFKSSFLPNDFEKTYKNYILKCENQNLIPVSKATIYNYYKSEKENLTMLFNASNIEHLHAQFIKLSDFDIFHKQLDCTKELATELINSVAVLEMLNYENLKLELKQIGFKTKDVFLKQLVVWLKERNWQGLNKMSNVRVLTRKASDFEQALKINRIEALKIVVNKKSGNRNALKFNETHKQIVLQLVKERKYKSKIQCFKDYQTECEKFQIEPVGEGTVSKFIIDEKIFEQFQKNVRQYVTPVSVNLTDEQKQILAYDDSLKINAVAGSGKTTTLIEYAKTRNQKSKFLYIAFNKSVKNEATKKFREKGIKIDVVTAHSLAYQNVVTKENKHLLASDLSPTEIINSLAISYDNPKEKNEKIILATHIKRFFEYFCNSSAKIIDDLNYSDIVLDSEAREFVELHIQAISHYTALLFTKMNNAEMRFTHDFYLKKFQLNNPRLDYDYIFFDEGQDASPAMLDVFIKQNAKKIIVGDSNQQIYSWRYAVNSLEKVGYKKFELSKSFRFGRDIANLAMDSLETKKHIGTYNPTTIIGLGKSKEIQTKATLARTNLKLLELALNDVFETKTVKSVYFEGHISTYKFGEKNSIMYDVLNLYFNKKDIIKNNLIREFSNFKELISYARKTEDNELSMLISLVMKYKGKLYSLINDLKEIHLSNGQKHEAGMIYSTVHKCKGMEYDEVTIANDFYTESNLIEKYSEMPTQHNVNKLNEEINLLYVAITRAKSKIHIPTELIPSKKTIEKFLSND
jgi:F-box protein, helicase, 18